MPTNEKKPISLASMSVMWGLLPLPDEHIADWLDSATAAGYEGVSTFDRDLLRLLAEFDLESRLRDAPLQLVSIDYIITRDFDLLAEVCTAMQRLGAKYLVTIGGLSKRGGDIGEVADVLNQIGAAALPYGIRTCYHNHTNQVGETLEETEELLLRTDADKICGFLDLGHATKDFVGHPIEERAMLFLEKHWARIEFLEFKDWSEDHDLCTEVGAGRCNWNAVFKLLKQRAYTGWIAVEQNGPMGARTRAESAEASCRFIREGLDL